MQWRTMHDLNYRGSATNTHGLDIGLWTWKMVRPPENNARAMMPVVSTMHCNGAAAAMMLNESVELRLSWKLGRETVGCGLAGCATNTGNTNTNTNTSINVNTNTKTNSINWTEKRLDAWQILKIQIQIQMLEVGQIGCRLAGCATNTFTKIGEIKRIGESKPISKFLVEARKITKIPKSSNCKRES